MIIYFSGTGNCKFAGEYLAENLGERAVPMLSCGDITLERGENLGIVVPTYFWVLPSVVEDFLKNVNVTAKGDNYIFCVASYGTTTGQVDYYISKLLKKKGLKLSASYALKTVDNWTVSFSVKDKEEIARLLEGEKLQLKEIVRRVKNRERTFITRDKKKAKWLCWGAKSCYQRARKTSHFRLRENCIGCGACEKGCPINAIEIQNGKPLWVKDKCALCFKCLHTCPVFAIQYEDKTQNNGQYIHP